MQFWFGRFRFVKTGKLKRVLPLLLVLGLRAQAPTKALIVNSPEQAWKDDGITLRQDAVTGGMELLVRFPAGHTFKPHWHESNERILVLQGQLAVKQGEKDSLIDAGGYAYLPAREVQHLSCTQKGRCVFYLGWDGNPASHNGEPPK